MFLHAPPKGRPDSYQQNLIVIEKPFENLVKMNNFTIRSCTSPSPARSGPWLPSWIPQGGIQKTLVFLVFLRCRPWDSMGGHCPQDADLTLIVKT